MQGKLTNFIHSFFLIYSETLKYGNHSITGKTWIGGPTDELKSQHVPGYSGYIP